MNDHLKHYMIWSGWTGYRQESSLSCDRCKKDVWESDPDAESFDVEFADLMALIDAHEREKHS